MNVLDIVSEQLQITTVFLRLISIRGTRAAGLGCQDLEAASEPASVCVCERASRRGSSAAERGGGDIEQRPGLPNVTVACLAELAEDRRRAAAASAGPLAVQPMAPRPGRSPAPHSAGHPLTTALPDTLSGHPLTTALPDTLSGHPLTTALPDTLRHSHAADPHLHRRDTRHSAAASRTLTDTPAGTHTQQGGGGALSTAQMMSQLPATHKHIAHRI